MAFVIPDAHKIDLRAALDAAGWDVEIADSAADAWWMNELWRVRSRWRPVGAVLFVSFIGDPYEEQISMPPRRVGDVGIGREPAEHYNSTNVARFALHPNWPAQMARIVACAAKLRDETQSGAE